MRIGEIDIHPIADGTFRAGPGFGVSRDDIDTVVCTHLHADHCGWLFDTAGHPTFPNADI